MTKTFLTEATIVYFITTICFLYYDVKFITNSMVVLAGMNVARTCEVFVTMNVGCEDNEIIERKMELIAFTKDGYT